MTKRIDLLLKEVSINPSDQELEDLKKDLKIYMKKLNQNIKSQKIDAEVFIGGSFAKKTMIKKKSYDIDLFIRFNKKYKEKELPQLTKNLLKDVKNLVVLHGSRDYFRINITPNFFLEIIPVIKVKNPKNAKNITDLSYSHVKYINGKIKSKRILEEIKIAKAFCYANNYYGAESYIGGFSGYALELLIFYYGSFLKFIKIMSKTKEKIIIDIEKHFKNRSTVLMNLNSSKLKSPIILIDPTYKQRNALAALSDETFQNFKKTCNEFLKNPSLKFFTIKKTNLEKRKSNAERKKLGFILIKIKTTKQKGDIAGTKLLKFYRHLNFEISKYFEIKDKGFSYDEKQSADCFFVVKPKKEILFIGPILNDKKNVQKFKKKHKKTFTKSGRIYYKEKLELDIKKFTKKWKNEYKKKIRDMSINKLEIVT
jgi:tRNA nucleotidyltransferase (CCA-adding enzyme)